MPTVTPLTMVDGFDKQRPRGRVSSPGGSLCSGHRFIEDEPVTQLPSGQDVPAQSPAASHPWLVPDSISFQLHAQLLGSANWQAFPESKKREHVGWEDSPCAGRTPWVQACMEPHNSLKAGGMFLFRQTLKRMLVEAGPLSPSGGTGSGQAGSGTQRHLTCPVLRKGREAKRSSATQSSRDLGLKWPLY